jgi:predicted nuclease of predicted toxin-antitoxin system
VKFLVDAQLPARLARALSKAGHDAVHTLQLPDRNRTSDADVASVADSEDRVVVTKDEDFVISHRLRGRPNRLLYVTVGNTSNDVLLDAVLSNIHTIEAAFDECSLVELQATQIISWPGSQQT